MIDEIIDDQSYLNTINDENHFPLRKVIYDLFSERNTDEFSDDYWIPINIEERKRKFPKAFEILFGNS